MKIWSQKRKGSRKAKVYKVFKRKIFKAAQNMNPLWGIGYDSFPKGRSENKKVGSKMSSPPVQVKWNAQRE